PLTIPGWRGASNFSAKGEWTTPIGVNVTEVDVTGSIMRTAAYDTRGHASTAEHAAFGMRPACFERNSSGEDARARSCDRGRKRDHKRDTCGILQRASALRVNLLDGQNG